MVLVIQVVEPLFTLQIILVFMLAQLSTMLFHGYAQLFIDLLLTQALLSFASSLTTLAALVLLESFCVTKRVEGVVR